MLYVLIMILQFTPFWAIPVAMIAGQFAYLYWLKGRQLTTLILALVVFVCIVCIGYYVWAGGHQGVADHFLR